METDNRQFLEAFKDVYEKDKNKYIKNWIVRWKYVDIVQNKDEFYQLNRLYSYNGKSELVDWFDYLLWNKKVNYFPAKRTAELTELARANDKRIIDELKLEFKWSNEEYDHHIGGYNAEDFQLQNFYPIPERNKVETILDFGAGFGRQANLWTQQKNTTYVGMDAIPNSYCVQNLYYGRLNVPFYEYVENPSGFKISTDKKGVYHLPTWRYDLLPSNTFDLVICSQVLSEINGKLAKKMINEFYRILKPGGALYVRDPGPYRHKSGNKVNIDKYIDNNGFYLEFRPYIIVKEDLWAFPRIWRKHDNRVEEVRREKFSLVNELNYYTNGLLKKVFRMFFKRTNSN
jgi:SAM-dependent methyltransferase